MEPRRRFRFLKELAAGGFGKVYLAEMVTGDNFSSVVAIKLLHGKWLGNDEIVMRSRDEARLLGRLRHRSIVRVEDLTSINGQCAIVMEYLHGADLKTACAWLKEQQRTFPRKSAFEIIAAVADALDAAFNSRPLQGGDPLRVVHRDIKPSNVMITVEGDVKVLDFGTARASFEEREAKTQALAFGSAAYMSPERHMGEDDTVGGDVFGLGVTAYEMLTLDTFGKIQVRQEKYEAQLAERMGVLNLGGIEPGVRADAIELLRSMLAYEWQARPSAAMVRERAEALADAMRDTGLRRFARDHVAIIAEHSANPIDPGDNFAGAVVHEDTSGMGSTGSETASMRTWDEPEEEHEVTSPGGAAPPPLRDPPSGVRPPPAPVGLATIRPADAPRASARPTPPPSIAAPALLDPVAGAVSPTPSSPAVPAGRRRPSNINLGPAPTIVEGGEPPAPVDEAPSLAQDRTPPARDPAPAGGVVVKLLAGAALLGVLLGGGALVAWLYYSSTTGPTGPTGVTPPISASPAPPDGADTMDWSPNAPGKGGVLLAVPAGAVEVDITNSTDFRTEWSGRKYLRLRDLAPGVYRTKVKPSATTPALRADFSVEAGRTCSLRFVVTGGVGVWEVAECR